MIERGQRTLQGMMYRYIEQYNTKRYVDKLEDIVKCFNLRVSRSIKMTPNDAYQPFSHSRVLRNLEIWYRKAINNRRKPKFNIGDKVRILRLPRGSVSQKGYKPTFLEEIFRIHQTNTRLQLPRYYLTYMNNDLITGSFQSHELSLVMDSCSQFTSYIDCYRLLST